MFNIFHPYIMYLYIYFIFIFLHFIFTWCSLLMLPVICGLERRSAKYRMERFFPPVSANFLLWCCTNNNVSQACFSGASGVWFFFFVSCFCAFQTRSCCEDVCFCDVRIVCLISDCESRCASLLIFSSDAWKGGAVYLQKMMFCLSWCTTFLFFKSVATLYLTLW